MMISTIASSDYCDCDPASNNVMTPITPTTMKNNRNRRFRTRRRTQQPSHRIGLCTATFLAAAATLLPLVSVTAFVTGPHRTRNSFSTTSATKTTTTAATISGSIRRSNTAAPVSMMCDHDTDKVSEFELGVGRALDTLRKDYPHLLVQPPDFSLYSRDIEFVDPSKIRLHGLQAYKNSFRLLHALVKLIYCTDKSEMTFRMCYDKARQNIRCSFNAHVVPREIFGGERTTLHVDGISVYELDRDTGNITQHRIEQLLINNENFQPKEGVIAALHAEHTMTVPSYAKSLVSTSSSNPMVLEFKSNDMISPLLRLGAVGGGPQQQQKQPTSLFAMEASGPDHASSSSSASASSSEQSDGFDWGALDRKNKSRKKFGLKPLTREEFIELEAQVQQMAQQQQQKAASAATPAAEMNGERKKPNFFEKLIGDVLQDTCESNFDCERPEICCDFGFKKMCCASGTPVGVDGLRQYAVVPVPVPVNVEEEPGNFHRY